MPMLHLPIMQTHKVAHFIESRGGESVIQSGVKTVFLYCGNLLDIKSQVCLTLIVQ